MDIIDTRGVITTGVKHVEVDVCHPQPEMFFIEDIARGLSMMPRYVGQMKKFYSVAEHSFFLSTLVGDDPKVELQALLHDASEAYTGDMPSPIKQLPEMSGYRIIEKRVLAAILTRFSLPIQLRSVIHDVDVQIRVNEKNHLKEKRGASGNALPVELRCWPWEVAEKMFLNRFHEIYRRIAPAAANGAVA